MELLEPFKSMENKGFTIIEIVVAIAIIAVLSAIVLFGITEYINKGKDSSIAGNLSVLIPAGEVYYNGNGSYEGFCDPEQNSVIKNTLAQMPQNPNGYCLADGPSLGAGLTSGSCCSANGQVWMAFMREFGNSAMARCVDSRGVQKEANIDECADGMSSGYLQCPDLNE